MLAARKARALLQAPPERAAQILGGVSPLQLSDPTWASLAAAEQGGAAGQPLFPTIYTATLPPGALTLGSVAAAHAPGEEEPAAGSSMSHVFNVIDDGLLRFRAQR